MNILIYKRNCLIGTSGGAEKVMCSMASHFAAAGNGVLLLTRDMRDGMPFYPLDSRVKLVQRDRPFGKLRHLCGKVLGRLAGTRFDRDAFIARENRAVVNAFDPDVIIATSPADAKEILRGQDSLPPVIVTLHSCPDYFFQKKRKVKEYVEILKRVAAVQVLQPSFVDRLCPYYDGKIVVIGNCVAPNGTSANVTAKRIICPARIEPDKGQYELTAAFCKIAKDFPDWRIDLYGDITHPEYKNACIDLAHRNGAVGQILFHGITTDIPAALADASICAFPSKFEGFSLGLTEAMAAGLPAVGFRFASGVNEVIDDGENGYLVPDVDDFAEKLKQLMSDENLRRTMGRKAKESMRRFAPENIWRQWDRLVAETGGRNA